MNYGVAIFIIISTLSLTNAFSQECIMVTPSGSINNEIQIKIQNLSQIDTLQSLAGRLIIHKKVLGIRLFKIGEGVSSEEIIHDGSEIRIYSRYDSYYKKDKLISHSNKYYFLNNDLAKYVAIEYERNNLNDSIRVTRSNEFYFSNKMIIETVLDNSKPLKLKKKVTSRIIEIADRKLKEYSLIKEYEEECYH